MANLVVNTLRVTGPAEDRERLEAAIESGATDHGEGSQCLKTYGLDWDKWRTEFPQWGDITPLGTLESSYSYEHWNPNAIRPVRVTKDDVRPVRTVEDVLVVKTVTEWGPPIDFVERLGTLLPRLEVNGSSLELTNGIFMGWRSRAGATELLERRSSVFLFEETFEWEKQGKVWKWVGEREADIEMMWDFLRLECVGQTDELRVACWLAYDALAFPETTLPSRANNYAYCLAGTIAEYRHALIPTGANAVSRTPDAPDSGEPQKAGTAGDDTPEPKPEPSGLQEGDFFGTLRRLRKGGGQ